MWRHTMTALFIVAGVSCAPRIPKPDPCRKSSLQCISGEFPSSGPLQPVRRILERYYPHPVPLVGPERPSLLSSTLLDYASLPILPAFVPDAKPRPVEVNRFGLQCRLNAGLDFLGHLRIGSSSFSTDSGADMSGRRVLVSPSFDPVAGCLAAVGTIVALLEGFESSVRNNGPKLVYSVFEVKFDAHKLTGITTRRSSVDAQPVLRDVIYAFRRMLPNGDEELVIIGPPSTFVSATVASAIQTEPAINGYTAVHLPTRRGASSSATLTFWGIDLARFRHLSDGNGIGQSPLHNEILQIGIDLNWFDGASAPEMNLLISKVSKNGDRVLELSPQR